MFNKNLPVWRPYNAALAQMAGVVFQSLAASCNRFLPSRLAPRYKAASLDRRGRAVGLTHKGHLRDKGAMKTTFAICGICIIG